MGGWGVGGEAGMGCGPHSGPSLWACSEAFALVLKAWGEGAGSGWTNAGPRGPRDICRDTCTHWVWSLR